MLFWITNCLAALVVSTALIVLFKRLAHTFELVDYPDKRKRHDGVVPLCGGLAIFATLAVVTLLRDNHTAFQISFWAGILITLSVGVIDDRNELSAAKRLAAQLLAALILVNPLAGPGIYVANMLPAGWAAMAFPVLSVIAVVFVIGLINSWNMIDGVDGLAGGCAATALFWIAVIAAWRGMGELVFPAFVLLAAVCGFLVFNMRSPWCSRAKIFLGDAGSTALGASIAYLVITLSSRGEVVFTGLLWIVIIPVVDTLSLIFRRLYAGRSPFAADRWHLHHLLLDRSFSPGATTNTIVAFSAVCGAVGCFGIMAGASNYLMAFGLLAPIAIHSAFVWVTSRRDTAWLSRSASAAVSQFNPLPPAVLRPEPSKNHVPVQQPANSRPSVVSDVI